MGKFKFRYETLKSVREAMEKKAQKELAEIDLKIKKKYDEIKSLEIKKITERRKFDALRKATISQIQVFEKYIESLEAEKQRIQIEINKLDDLRYEKQKELMKKAQEVKIMEKLKEKHLEDFIREENKTEQKQIDETATGLFVRNKEE